MRSIQTVSSINHNGCTLSHHRPKVGIPGRYFLAGTVVYSTNLYQITSKGRLFGVSEKIHHFLDEQGV
jgi:hypothetical protein